MESCRVLVIQSDWRQFAETRRWLTSNRLSLEWIAVAARARGEPIAHRSIALMARRGGLEDDFTQPFPREWQWNPSAVG